MAAWYEADQYGPRDETGRWVGSGATKAAETARRVLANPAQASDDEVMDTFRRLGKVKRLSRDRLALLDQLGAELDARDERARKERQEAEDPPELRAARLRADELIAAGRPIGEAFMEAFGAIAGDEAASTDVDRRKGETREQTRRRLYKEQTYLVMLHAEAYTNGHMLSDEGKRYARRIGGSTGATDAGVGAVLASLFSGPEKRARKYASEDLLRFWAEVEPRRTYAEWRAERLQGAAGARKRVAKQSGKDFI